MFSTAPRLRGAYYRPMPDASSLELPPAHPARALPLVAVLALLPLACASDDAGTDEATTDGDGDGEGEGAGLSYWADAKAVIDAKCVSCHRPDDIAPFSLTTLEEVRAVAAILPAALASGSMPPWSPSPGCQDFEHDRSLSEAELALLLEWLADGAPEGDPADAPPDPEPGQPFAEDAVLVMPEAYTPTQEPDDYRCFVLPWDEDEERFVTGYQFRPDQRELAHHVTISAVAPASVAELEAMDAADPGPGYTCFGDIGVPGRALGGWVPGSLATTFPEGTGMRISPGSKLVLQMHYNTSSATPTADRSGMALSLAESVERPLTTLPILDFGWPTGTTPMTIPAGESKVTHAATISLDSPLVGMLIQELGAEPGEPLLVHQVGMHMHYLGVSGQLRVHHADGTETCALDIGAWDFNWQGRYVLREPLELGPGDTVEITCSWDNSAANQPIIDGAIGEPIEVGWGDGTQDEMCLGSMVVSRP